MKRPLIPRHAVLAALALAMQFGNAQEVRRALPVGSPDIDNYRNPSWVDQVAPAQPVTVRRAEAVPKPPPVATPPPTPALETMPAAAASSPGETGFSKADGLFARKLYELAIPEYERFLVSSPGATGRDVALFRLAECHRLTGNPGASRAACEKLVSEFQSGPSVAAAAFRLGEALSGEKRYEPAALQFELAARETNENNVRLAALYSAARNHEFAGHQAAAEAGYRALMNDFGSHAHRQNAALALAALQMKSGKKQGALETSRFLAIHGETSEISARAALQGARLARELGQSKVALPLLDQAASQSPDPQVRAEAVSTTLRMLFESKDFNGVTSRSALAGSTLTGEARAEALRWIAAAWRESGQDNRAREIYDKILAEHPAEAGSDTRFQRLLSLHATRDPSIPAEVDAFLQTRPPAAQAASAMLLKAEFLFQEGRYAEAAAAYMPLPANPSLRPEQASAALYKLAWSQAASGQNEAAIQSFGAFLAKHPSDKLAASALLHRGLCKLRLKDTNGAVGDFETVIQSHPYSKEVELALLQKALALGQKERHAEMAAAFRQLLERFPNTSASAQAHFWLGWAAFEEKKYAEAIPLFDKARLLDATNYGDRAALRLVLAHYQLQDRQAAAREATSLRQALPPEIVLWLAQGALNDQKPALAEKWLDPLAASPGNVPAEAWILLAEAKNQSRKAPEAVAAAEKFLSLATEPAAQARGLIAKSRALLAQGRSAESRTAVDQALYHQPEGRWNAEARLLSGDIHLAANDPASAARAYMAVAVLTDDPVLTPDALRRAIAAYQAAGNTAEAAKATDELAERFPSAAR